MKSEELVIKLFREFLSQMTNAGVINKWSQGLGSIFIIKPFQTDETVKVTINEQI